MTTDCENTEDLICPFCGHKYDAYDIMEQEPEEGKDEDFTCEKCDKMFIFCFETCTSFSFTSSNAEDYYKERIENCKYSIKLNKKNEHIATHWKNELKKAKEKLKEIEEENK